MNGKCLKYESSATIKKWIYLFKTFVRYYDTSKSATDTMEFLIPVKIIAKGKKLIIHQNLFRRDIRTYFDHGIFIEKKSNIENDIIENIKHNYSNSVFRLDLNKGIKDLWTNDFIDAIHVKNRESKSIRQDRMDENFLYKSSYPSEWNQLIKISLQKTKFKSLSDDIELDHFDCNPSTGFLSVSHHPQSVDEIDELLKLILKHN